MVRSFYSFKTLSEGLPVHATCSLEALVTPARLSLCCIVSMTTGKNGALSAFMREATRLGLKTRFENNVHDHQVQHCMFVDHNPAQLVELFDGMLGKNFQTTSWEDPRQTLREIVSAYRTCPHVAMLARSNGVPQGDGYENWCVSAWMSLVMYHRLNAVDGTVMVNHDRVDLDRLLEDMLRGGTVTYAWDEIEKQVS